MDGVAAAAGSANVWTSRNRAARAGGGCQMIAAVRRCPLGGPLEDRHSLAERRQESYRNCRKERSLSAATCLHCRHGARFRAAAAHSGARCHLATWRAQPCSTRFGSSSPVNWFGDGFGDFFSPGRKTHTFRVASTSLNAPGPFSNLRNPLIFRDPVFRPEILSLQRALGPPCGNPSIGVVTTP